MALIDGIARHLTDLGLANYDDTAALSGTWPVAVDTMPSGPDQIVALTGYGGPEADSKLGYDTPRVQARVRGTRDSRVSRQQAQAIYDALHGLGPVVLPDGTAVISCIGLQSSPQSLGTDDNDRHEHVVNFEFEIRNTTGLRV